MDYVEKPAWYCDGCDLLKNCKYFPDPHWYDGKPGEMLCDDCVQRRRAAAEILSDLEDENKRLREENARLRNLLGHGLKNDY